MIAVEMVKSGQNLIHCRGRTKRACQWAGCALWDRSPEDSENFGLSNREAGMDILVWRKLRGN